MQNLSIFLLLTGEENELNTGWDGIHNTAGTSYTWIHTTNTNRQSRLTRVDAHSGRTDTALGCCSGMKRQWGKVPAFTCHRP